MKHLAIALSTLLLLFGMIGCSDDDNPVAAPDDSPDNTATSVWDSDSLFWTTTVDASDYDDFMYFSFATQDTVSSGISKPTASVWDIAFCREVIKLNGGSSTENEGDVVACDLEVTDYASVTIDDTTGVTWVADYIDYFIDDWYSYNPTTHQISMTQYVYSMLDATGEHYVKFQVDSLVGAGAPPQMGTVWLSYYYQDTVDSRSLRGSVVKGFVDVGSDHGYFDFSAGHSVTPADPSTSLDWDIAFYSYDLMQNSGPNGSGDCAAFLAYTELDDPTDIDAFDEQPAMAPLFPDIPGSALTEWYDYNGTTHTLTSKSHVYLIKTGGIVYKLQILSYYESIGGVPTSGHYTFKWNEL